MHTPNCREINGAKFGLQASAQARSLIAGNQRVGNGGKVALQTGEAVARAPEPLAHSRGFLRRHECGGTASLGRADRGVAGDPSTDRSAVPWRPGSPTPARWAQTCVHSGDLTESLAVTAPMVAVAASASAWRALSARTASPESASSSRCRAAAAVSSVSKLRSTSLATESASLAASVSAAPARARRDAGSAANNNLAREPLPPHRRAASLTRRKTLAVRTPHAQSFAAGDSAPACR